MANIPSINWTNQSNHGTIRSGEDLDESEFAAQHPILAIPRARRTLALHRTGFPLSGGRYVRSLCPPGANVAATFIRAKPFPKEFDYDGTEIASFIHHYHEAPALS